MQIAVTLAAMLLALVNGCAKTPRDSSKAGTSSMVPDTLWNGFPASLVTRSAEWTDMWSKVAPGFIADSLIPAGRAFGSFGRSESPLERSLVAGTDSTVLREVMGDLSPSGRYVLVADAYRALPDPEVENPAGGEPDHAAILIDTERRTAETFLFCGTPCTFDWGGWLDSTRFAVAGSESDEADSCYGFVRLYSISQNLVTTWHTRSVPVPLRDVYYAATEERLMGRCRAWKSAHRRS